MKTRTSKTVAKAISEWVEPLEERRLLSAVPELVSDMSPRVLWGTQTGTGYANRTEVINNTIFFTVIDASHSEPSHELWKSDGTSQGTAMIHELGLPVDISSNPYAFNDFAAVNGLVYFSAWSDANGYALWKTDGTASGTTMVKDLNPGTDTVWNTPRAFTSFNNVLYFSANDGVHGSELWKSDGTTAGTMMVKDIRPGDGSYPYELTVVGNTLFFIADDGVHGAELWKSNGTEAGTILVKDIGAGWTNHGNLTEFNGALYFLADDQIHGREVWTSDGTAMGTALLKDINPGPASSSPWFADVGGALYLSANDGVSGLELWKSDGTEAGTVLVKDINPGPGGSGPGGRGGFTSVGGTVLFGAHGPTGFVGLWKSDGTEAGTVHVKDIRLVSERVASVNGMLYFTGEDATNGSELWRSDGTTDGTVMVQDFRPDGDSSDPRILTEFGGALYFYVNNGLWKISPPPNTPTGTDVTLEPLFQGTGTPPDLEMTFDSITSEGLTTVTPITDAPPPPGGLTLTGQSIIYDISTTATFEGSAEICFSYDEAQVGNESNLQLHHYENSQWVNITTSLDTVNNVICGVASSFSPFAVFESFQEVQIDVRPDSINLTSNAIIPVVLYTTPQFNAAQANVASMKFADAAPVFSALKDVDGDGDLDLVLHFRTQDTDLRDIYEQLLIDDADADGILDSTRQTAQVFLTGQTIEETLFEGSDDLNLFLSGKALRDLLDSLATQGLL